jgi:predicted DNA-binding mobile mystery protein A
VKLLPDRLHRQRAQLDHRLAKLKPLIDLAARPRTGWLRAIRESLGMTAQQLGHRLGGISRQSVLKLETSESRQTITLGSLERAAAALGCRLVYAIVPDDSLEAQLDRRVGEISRRGLERTSHSMRLEGQEPPAELVALQIEDRAKRLKEELRHVWDER